MTHIIAVTNQKGGVGKTTTAVNLAAELALRDYRVLLVDLDPQGNATSGLGIEKPEEGNDLYDVFFGDRQLGDVLKESQVPNLFVAPASADLVGLETEMGKRPGRELILRSEIQLVSDRFDFVLIDCPPSSGLLTLNAMGAAKFVLVPLQAEYYALEGISALLSTIDFVRKTFNSGLRVLGVLMTMVDPRTRLSGQVVDEARGFFGDQVFRTVVPRSVKLSEAPSHGVPIALYDRLSPGARAYMELMSEVVERVEFGEPGGAMAANG